ncbi:MAG TPA: hypothetical protein PLB59_09705 [Bacteroidales bacterium]|jgi:hypothetical protein|nr:hypothetical protein [Bacteroidales bacterium]HQP16232.1 hypothetical protein [Bacteroidales bacterium]
MKPFRILLASPISDYKNYILPQWIRYIKSLQRSYDTNLVSLDVVLADNSQNSAFYKQVSREFKINVVHVDPMFKNSREFICDSRNRLRDVFLNGKYNMFLSVECDVFPPANFITHLLSHHKKIISLPYFIGEGIQSQPMIQMVDPQMDIPREIRNISEGELFSYAGKTIRVFNAGLGCTLIRRDVVENISFRWDKEIFFHDDSFFAEDCYNSGIKWYCDTSMICRHLNKPWNYFPENKF